MGELTEGRDWGWRAQPLGPAAQELVELRTGNYTDLKDLERDLLTLLDKSRIVPGPLLDERSPKASRPPRAARPGSTTEPGGSPTSTAAADAVRGRVAQAVEDLR